MMLCFCYNYTIPVEEGSVVRIAIMLCFCCSYTLSPANRYIIPKGRTHYLCTAAHKRTDWANSYNTNTGYAHIQAMHIYRGYAHI